MKSVDKKDFVEDNGVGITTEDRNRIFSIKINVSKSGTANEKGTGLGLSLCQEMIEQNGGTISVESEANFFLHKNKDLLRAEFTDNRLEEVYLQEVQHFYQVD